MEKLIELSWQNEYDETRTGEAIVEYVTIEEDAGKPSHEVLGVFLPENVPTFQYEELRQEAIKAFYNGEGYNL